jgi:hypothetical protein
MDEYENDQPSRRVPATIGNHTILIEMTSDDEEEVAGRSLHFADFTETLSTVANGITNALGAGLHKVKPDKVTLELGCEIGVAAGQLTAVLVKGTAKANIKVTLEWSPEKAAPNESSS